MNAMQSKDTDRLSASAQSKTNLVYETFSNRRNLEDAIEDLTQQGFTGDKISVFLSHEGNLLDEEGRQAATKLGEGIVVGTVAGVIIGALLAWTVGIEPLSVSEFGQTSRHWYIAASAVIGGMIGAVAGAIIGLVIPEYGATRYDTKLKEGTYLVRVRADDPERSLAAKTILETHGGKTVDFAEVSRVTKKAA